jgi:uncharacterized protein YjbI with pentapeptide repeats
MGARKWFIAFMVLGLFLAVNLAFAFDEKQVQQLRKTNRCQKCDLSGAKVNGLDLSYADVSSANLSGAD